MTKEALKLALDAIEELRYSSSTFKSDRLSAEAITAIKQALAAPVLEPVATGDTLFRQFMSEAEKAGVTHWPTPPAAQPTGRAPCERHCEANAFKIEIRGLRKQLEEAQPSLKPIRPNVDTELDANQRLGFKYGWKSCEEAHGIKGGA